MNWDQLQGQWHLARGKLREKWGKLTDDDLDMIAGKRDRLVGLLQKHYGEARDEIERQVSQFEKACSML
jgi:uncharacterized protein YjbJ (UPF0337 family)